MSLCLFIDVEGESQLWWRITDEGDFDTCRDITRAADLRDLDLHLGACSPRLVVRKAQLKLGELTMDLGHRLSKAAHLFGVQLLRVGDDHPALSPKGDRSRLKSGQTAKGHGID